MSKYFKLFCSFFKIGAFTFGGGYAMIPLIQQEVVTKQGWISDEEMLDVIAIAESTPGPIAVNSATFVGTKVGGIWGAACATFGLIVPSFVIITALFYVLQQIQSYTAVKYAFWGIRAGVLALVLKAFWSMFKKCKKDWLSIILMLAAFCLSLFWDINVIIIIAGCALIGLASFLIANKEAAK